MAGHHQRRHDAHLLDPSAIIIATIIIVNHGKQEDYCFTRRGNVGRLLGHLRQLPFGSYRAVMVVSSS